VTTTLSDPVERAVAAEMARQDLYFFSRLMFQKRKKIRWQRAKHHKRVAQALMRVFRGECKRLLLHLPPRYSKTELGVVNFMAWALGHEPDAEFLHLSYSAELAEGNSWNAREVVSDDLYREIFPGCHLEPGSRAQGNWRTTEGGVVYAAGFDGTITGKGAGKMRAPDDNRFGGCFPAHQMIETEHGPRAIGDVVRAAAPLRVWSWSETTSTRELRDVKTFWRNPANDLIRVHLSDGTSFECTPDHEVLTGGGWLPALRLADALNLVDRQPGKAGQLLAGESPVKHQIDDELRVLWSTVPFGVRQMLRDACPRLAQFDLSDDADAHTVDVRELRSAFGRLENLKRLGPVEFCAGPALEDGESTVPERVLHVVGLCAIREIARRVVGGAPIEMPDLVSVGSWAYELLRDQMRYVAAGDDPANGQVDTEVPLSVGTRFKRAQGDGAPDPAQIGNLVQASGALNVFPVFVEYVGHADETFCLEVEGNHNFVLSQSGAVVSNCIIIDDPHKAGEALSETMLRKVREGFQTTIESRKNDARTPIIVIMQRLHEHDLAGWLASGGNGEEWEVVRIPVFEEIDTGERDKHGHPIIIDGEPIWPEKHSRETLQAMEEANPYVFAGQYRQRPAPPAGGNIKPGMLGVIDALPAGCTTFVRGWDLAASTTSKSPFTAGVKLARAPNGRTIIVDVVRERGTGDQVRTIMRNTADRDGATTLQSIPQDPGQAGKVQAADFAKILLGHRLSFSPESGDKVLRAEPIASQINVGNVDMIRAPWNQALVNEMATFPNGFKDQVDALSRAFSHMDNSMERFRALAGG
jgi:predicted phage terminase large subunit-like protein